MNKDKRITDSFFLTILCIIKLTNGRCRKSTSAVFVGAMDCFILMVDKDVLYGCNEVKYIAFYSDILVTGTTAPLYFSIMNFAVSSVSRTSTNAFRPGSSFLSGVVTMIFA